MDFEKNIAYCISSYKIAKIDLNNFYINRLYRGKTFEINHIAYNKATDEFILLVNKNTLQIMDGLGNLV